MIQKYSCFDPRCVSILPVDDHVDASIDQLNARERLNRLCETIDDEISALEIAIHSEKTIKSDQILNVRLLLKDFFVCGHYIFIDSVAKLAWEHYYKRIIQLLAERLAHLENTIGGEFVVENSTQLHQTESLRHNSFFEFDITIPSLRRLSKSFGPQIQVLKDRLNRGHSLREEMSINAIPRDALLDLNKVLQDEGILNAASAGIGAKLQLGGVAVELSVPNAKWWVERVPFGQASVSRTAYFHRDESVWAPKAMIYLSEVTDECGPFTIAVGSNRGEISPISAAASRIKGEPAAIIKRAREHADINHETRTFFSLLPKSLAVDSHYGFLIPDSNENSQAIMDVARSFVGAAGKGICFDGYSLLHRGGLTTKLPRLALQIILRTNRNWESKWIDLLSGTTSP